MTRTGICPLFLMMLAGCASENLYEGLRMRETTLDALTHRSASSRVPSYQDYEAERKKLLKHK